MLSIVVVEAHALLREALTSHLRAAGYDVVGAADDKALTEGIVDAHPELYVLADRFPGTDGLALARRLRSVEPALGIVMLSDRTTVADRVAGYEAGADAFLTKPVTLDEVAAVVASLVRRLRPTSRCPFLLDAVRAKLIGPSGERDLTIDQVALLESLAHARPQGLESRRLMAAIGRSAQAYSKAALEVQIVRLRERLTSVGAPRDALVAVRGFGYRLTIELQIRRLLRSA